MYACTDSGTAAVRTVYCCTHINRVGCLQGRIPYICVVTFMVQYSKERCEVATNYTRTTAAGLVMMVTRFFIYRLVGHIIPGTGTLFLVFRCPTKTGGTQKTGRCSNQNAIYDGVTAVRTSVQYTRCSSRA